jgi:hypothetical protein
MSSRNEKRDLADVTVPCFSQNDVFSLTVLFIQHRSEKVILFSMTRNFYLLFFYELLVVSVMWQEGDAWSLQLGAELLYKFVT